jgi:hypothetical protein
MTSEKEEVFVVDANGWERQIVAGMVVGLLPVLRTDVNQSIAMHKSAGKGGYLDGLEGAGLLDWKTAPAKTCNHVTAESGGRQSTLPGTFKE